MRKIIKEAVDNFYNGILFRRSNTEVFHLPGRYVMCLYGNKIAELDIKGNIISVYDGGHKTQTTKERINGVLAYKGLGGVFQKDKEWFYMDETGKARPFAGGVSRVIPFRSVAKF